MSKASPGMRVKAVVSYDGTGYAGWQVQPRKHTIQGELERCIRKLTSETVRVNCSGRTDAGVHANGQVVHFDLQNDFPQHRILPGLNRYLPDDIRIEKTASVPATFDARFSATGKEYRYFIWNAPVLPACRRLHWTHIKQPLDLAAMRQAATILEGRHDYAAFSANPGHEREGTVRNVTRLSVSRRGPEYIIRAEGEGFLYKMVRSLAGFLMRVGTGAVPPNSAKHILASKTRTAKVPTAPPQGLFLWRVSYAKRKP